MKLAMGSNILFRAMVVLWGYDVLKFAVAFNIMHFYMINPWIFLILDVVTVPTYIIGWNRLIASLTGEIKTFRALFKWSLITFISSTVPYFYAAWAGRQTFPKQVWLVFSLILIFLLVNLIRKIYCNKKCKLILNIK